MQERLTRISQHEVCIELLEAINHYNKRIFDAKCNINGYRDTFFYTGLLKRFEHNIEIYGMCVKRLEERYNKLVDKINSEKF